MMIISVIFAVAYFLLVALVAALVFRAIGKYLSSSMAT